MREEVTDQEMVIYYRGMLTEYKRNHPELTKEERIALFDWVNKSQSIHSNPYWVYKGCGSHLDDFITGYRAYQKLTEKK